MKILILSHDGDGLGIAQKLSEEGHDVRMYIKDPQYKHAGKGIVTRVPSWRPVFKNQDLIICDMVGFGQHEETLRTSRAQLFSCSQVMDQIELDRKKGHEVFKKFDIQTPITLSYSNPDAAREVLNMWDDFPNGVFVKPSGNVATAKTQHVKTQEHLSWFLDSLPTDGELIIQDVVKGIEVSTEGWFNGRDWITPFNHTFEEKQLLPGAGPNTGCMGNVVITTEGDKLVEETVMKLTPLLKKISYRGPIDVNAIVNSDGVHALEFTSRLGYDAIEALLEGLKEPVLDLFFETAVGTKRSMEITKDFMIAVRVSRAPWPHDNPEESDKGMPILGINEDNLKHLFLTDVFKEDEDYFYAAGDGVIAKATARGRSIQEARNRVYRTVESLIIPSKQFRKDIGKRVDNDMRTLQEGGWL